MNPLPTLFLSHGAPDLPLQDNATTRFLSALSQQLPKPKVILSISAHWPSPMPMVSTAQQPETIHDFSGFSEKLYQIRYRASGAPELAHRVRQLLTEANIPCTPHPWRGFDHGTCTPLMLLYPEAEIPITQLSIQPRLDPLHHWQLGQALSPLRDEGVLMIGTGSATHNLYALSRDDNAPPDWVQAFDSWLAETIARGDWKQLLQYRELAPHAQANHPTPEHLLPLFVAFGASGSSAQGKQLHSGYTYGVLSMATYAFF